MSISLHGDPSISGFRSDPAMKYTSVASDERSVASCRSRRTARLGANERRSFRSSDMLSWYNLGSCVDGISSTGPRVAFGTTWLRISFNRRTGKLYMSEVICGREGTAVLEDDMFEVFNSVQRGVGCVDISIQSVMSTLMA